MWLLLVLLLASARAESDYASDPVAVKHAGRVCFTLYPVAAHAQMAVAHYESHAKQWRVDELALASPGGPAGCFTVAKPGLYRAMYIRVTLPPSASAEGGAGEPLVLVTGPVHYITAPPTTAPPTTTMAPTSAPDAPDAGPQGQHQGHQEECACPCMTGAPECTTVNKCFGIYCGAHGGTCDAGSGQCVCPDEFTGPNCQTPACSWHGFYSPLTEQCVCRMGWGGYACQVCAVPMQSGYQYICVPHVRAASNNAVAYLLMAVSASDARDFLSGVKRADPQLPYHAIYPNTVGFDGQRYDCECVSAASAADALRRRKGRYGPPLGARIDPGALDAYNATVVQCIENSNATAEQTSDMIGLWTTCVSFQQKGLLTDSWWIACIILGIVALAELVAIIMGCVVWSSQARLWKELEMPNKIR